MGNGHCPGHALECFGEWGGDATKEEGVPLQQLDDPPHEHPGTNFAYGTRLQGLPLRTEWMFFYVSLSLICFFCMPTSSYMLRGKERSPDKEC